MPLVIAVLKGAIARSWKSRLAMGGRENSTNSHQPCREGNPEGLPAGEQSNWETISADLTITQRDLPHWQVGGATYFITFRLKGHAGPETSGTGVSPVDAALSSLTPFERTIVRDAILFWHGRKWMVDALTVMPDHVHILATSLERSPGEWFSLAELMHSVKSFTAHKIQRLSGVSGAFWQSERYDRVNRNEFEFYQKATYILENAQRRGLVEHGWEYEWFWCPGKEELRGRVGRG